MSANRQDVRSRTESEAEFHDARINTSDEQRQRLSYAYESVADVYEFGSVPTEHMDATVLEVGCFLGDQAVALRGFSGRYLGIDISPAAIEHCRGLGLSGPFSFLVDDANFLDTIEDGSVNYAFGHGVLHHLELERFAPALARKLAPGGVARFVEPAQGNLALRAFRKLTPNLRTPDEYPFDGASIALLRNHFDVRIAYKALVRPFVPMLFLNNRSVTRVARRVDDWLLRYPILQRQAWLLQIELGRQSG